MVKAAVCRAFGSPFEIEDVEIAEPGLGEIRVAVKACAICHSDIMYARGAWGGTLPAVYGHEAAGVVESVGEHVADLALGDRVVVSLMRSCGGCRDCVSGSRTCCSGDFGIDNRTVLVSASGEPLVHGLHTAAFAELALVHASQVVKVADFVPWSSAALLGCGVITGYGAVVNTAGVEVGSHVAVVGCGGVGLNAVQASVLAGARTVIAVDPAPDKRLGAVEFGASHAVDPSAPDAISRVRSIADNRGVDYVFVTVGSGSAISAAQWLAAPGGAVVIVGMTETGVNPEIDTTMLAESSQRLLGSKMGSGCLRIDIDTLVDLYRQRRYMLDELVSETFPLERINEAVTSLAEGSVRRNVIRFDGEQAR